MASHRIKEAAIMVIGTLRVTMSSDVGTSYSIFSVKHVPWGVSTPEPE